MTNVLVIHSSASGDASVSRGLTRDLLARMRAADPSMTVVERDLGLQPVPQLTEDAVAALRRAEVDNEPRQAAQRLSEALLSEVEAADILVIGSPMYNFGISTQLKAWFDHILRAGRTFRYTPNGPEGLLKGKRAIVIVARGGVYSQGPGLARNHQEGHLTTMLGFMGIADVEFAIAEGLAVPEKREQGLAQARARIEELLAEPLVRSAA